MFKTKRLTDDLTLISDRSIADDASEHPVYVLFGDEEYTLLFDSLFNKASYYETLKRIDQAVRAFDAFNPDNDPYGEHDFGTVQVEGHVVMFKIDCYDLDLQFASPDPSDPDVTCRIMTIMLADEY